MCRKKYYPHNNASGFTLIEILLVTIIIGVMLAVIVPRAWRANTEAKYNVLRQSCTELANVANEWAQRQVESQPNTATSNMADYMDSLTNSGNVRWIGESSQSNWNINNPTGYIGIPERGVGPDQNPTAKVQQLLPPDKGLRNPFNGTSVFDPTNDGSSSTPVPGAIGCAYDNASPPDTYRYYALIFLGAENTLSPEFYAGQGTDMAGLRSGIFLARLEP